MKFSQKNKVRWMRWPGFILEYQLPQLMLLVLHKWREKLSSCGWSCLSCKETGARFQMEWKDHENRCRKVFLMDCTWREVNYINSTTMNCSTKPNDPCRDAETLSSCPLERAPIAANQTENMEGFSSQLGKKVSSLKGDCPAEFPSTAIRLGQDYLT